MSAPVDDVAATLSSLSDSLWTLRELLGLTEYGLVVQRLIAEAGETRHLSTAADQLDDVCLRIRRVEVVRAGLVEAAGRALGCSHDVTLVQLAEASPEPWGLILAEHAEALRAATGSVATHRLAAERVLHAGADAVDNALRSLVETEPPGVGAVEGLVASGSRLDRRA